MGVFINACSELEVVLQIPSISSRADSSLNPSANDESDLVRRLHDQISRLNRDMTTLHAMATLVKRKSEIATVIEQHALDRLRVATESLSCKHLFIILLKFYPESFPSNYFFVSHQSWPLMNRNKTGGFMKRSRRRLISITQNMSYGPTDQKLLP
jgi:hypothetical protein